ncbi:MAG TPA: A24 family peptidase [Acidimicrobiales bacterium]|nr:A24 family peptidase [Acidimicrobiales bacterium]
MTAELIAGASVTGLVAGALLDPLGQRLAEHSRRTQRRKDEAAAVVPAGTPAGHETEPPQLLPVGVSPVRTAGAALVTAALVGGAAARFGPHLTLVPFSLFFCVLVAVSTTDLSHGLIPRRLVYPAFVAIFWLLALVAAVDGEWHRLASAGVGAAVTFAVLFVLWWLAPRGIGFGDVRLSALIGLATGWIGLLDVYVGVVSGFILGLLFGIGTMAVRGSGRRVRIPFAPALAGGAVVAVFWGAPIVHTVFHGTL